MRGRRAGVRVGVVLAVVGSVAIAGCDGSPTAVGAGEGSEPITVNHPGPGAGEGGGSAAAFLVASVPDLTAVDLQSGVSLEQLARRWVGHAERVFERAVSLAGPDPQPPVSAWLQAAAQQLAQAQGSLAGGQYQAAIAQAQASVASSGKVIDQLSGSDDGPDLEARAAEAIATAGELLDRAIELAGPAPEERVRAALTRAAELLATAEAAFEAGAFATALRVARESAGLSRAVIRYLGG